MNMLNPYLREVVFGLSLERLVREDSLVRRDDLVDVNGDLMTIGLAEFLSAHRTDVAEPPRSSLQPEPELGASCHVGWGFAQVNGRLQISDGHPHCIVGDGDDL